MLTLEMPALNQLVLQIIHLAVSAPTLHMDYFFGHPKRQNSNMYI